MEERVQLETDIRGLLDRRRALYDPSEVAVITAVGSDDSTRDLTRADRTSRQLEHLAVVREATEQFSIFTLRERREALARFRENPAPVTDDWCRTVMSGDHLRTWLGLGETKETWPSPRRIPSLWRYIAHRVARVYLVHSGREQPDANDEFDARIYADTAYADTFVTDDAGFRRTIELASPPRPKVLSLADWIEQI